MWVTSQIFNTALETLENRKRRCHTLCYQWEGCVHPVIFLSDKDTRNCLSLCLNPPLLQNPYRNRLIAINTSLKALPAPPLALELVPAMGEGAAPAKTAASGVDSLFRDTGRLVASFQAKSLIPLVFILEFPFSYFR